MLKSPDEMRAELYETGTMDQLERLHIQVQIEALESQKLAAAAIFGLYADVRRHGDNRHDNHRRRACLQYHQPCPRPSLSGLIFPRPFIRARR
jgi:hypothetical protein